VDSTRDAPSRSALQLLLPAGAGVLFCVLAWQQGLCTQDDAFISFRYARNLVDGHGLVYNPGERVEGYTNFLWTLLLALALALDLDPLQASRVLGIACGAALVLWTWRTAEAVVGARPGLRLVAALLTALSPPLLLESAMGLETALFALLVLVGCQRAAVELARPGAFPGHALVFAAAALTRPEGVLLYALALAGIALPHLRRPAALLPGLARSALVFALPVAAHLAWRLHYYGHPFPNTFYAKAGGGLENARLGLEYLANLLRSLGFLPPLLACLACARAGSPALRALLCVTAGQVAYVVAVGGDFKPTYRFFVPILAPLWLLAAAGLAVLVDLAARLRPGAERAAAALACAAGIAGAAALPLSFSDTFELARQRRDAVSDPIRREIAAWFRENTPPGETLVMASAGLVPYYSGVRTIDMWGLTDPVIARSPQLGDPWPGHQRSHPRYLLERRPLYFLFSPRHGLPRRSAAQIRGQYAVERQVLALPEFHERYEILNAPLAGGHLYVFRRRDG
jgi:hypothetical protein